MASEFQSMVGTSAPIREVERALGWLAVAEVNLLLQGEAGTGKRVLAEAIHAQSPRGAGPFFAVSLSGRPEVDVEVEMFGRDGESGLVATRGATLYLEDISTLSMRLQRRLARVLRSDPARRGARIIASTLVELEEAVRLGRFLPDLHAHLGLIRLTVPPLRERREDIVALTEYFVRRYCERTGVLGIAVARTALAELTAYAWPGNARELQQTLEAALALTRGQELTAERIRTVLGRRPRRYVAPDVFPLRELERDYIATVLARCNWNQSLAARRLGIGRNTLMRKIKSFKLERSEAA
ncbi:MAG TPA: sigma 54-interacting transcriptional regulator [Candidatus Binatia bacterium]|jgi:two-component system response regulator HydG